MDVTSYLTLVCVMATLTTAITRTDHPGYPNRSGGHPGEHGLKHMGHQEGTPSGQHGAHVRGSSIAGPRSGGPRHGQPRFGATRGMSRFGMHNRGGSPFNDIGGFQFERHGAFGAGFHGEQHFRFPNRNTGFGGHRISGGLQRQEGAGPQFAGVSFSQFGPRFAGMHGDMHGSRHGSPFNGDHNNVVSSGINFFAPKSGFGLWGETVPFRGGLVDEHMNDGETRIKIGRSGRWDRIPASRGGGPWGIGQRGPDPHGNGRPGGHGARRGFRKYAQQPSDNVGLGLGGGGPGPGQEPLKLYGRSDQGHTVDSSNAAKYVMKKTRVKVNRMSTIDNVNFISPGNNALYSGYGMNRRHKGNTQGYGQNGATNENGGHGNGNGNGNGNGGHGNGNDNYSENGDLVNGNGIVNGNDGQGNGNGNGNGGHGNGNSNGNGGYGNGNDNGNGNGGHLNDNSNSTPDIGNGVHGNGNVGHYIGNVNDNGNGNGGIGIGNGGHVNGNTIYGFGSGKPDKGNGDHGNGNGNDNGNGNGNVNGSSNGSPDNGNGVHGNGNGVHGNGNGVHGNGNGIDNGIGYSSTNNGNGGSNSNGHGKPSNIGYGSGSGGIDNGNGYASNGHVKPSNSGYGGGNGNGNIGLSIDNSYVSNGNDNPSNSNHGDSGNSGSGFRSGSNGFGEYGSGVVYSGRHDSGARRIIISDVVGADVPFYAQNYATPFGFEHVTTTEVTSYGKPAWADSSNIAGTPDHTGSGGIGAVIQERTSVKIPADSVIVDSKTGPVLNGGAEPEPNSVQAEASAMKTNNDGKHANANGPDCTTPDPHKGH